MTHSRKICGRNENNNCKDDSINCSSDVDPDLELEWIELCIGAQRYVGPHYISFVFVQAVLNVQYQRSAIEDFLHCKILSKFSPVWVQLVVHHHSLCV